MIKKDLKLMYETIYREYNRLDDECFSCEDIDCEKCYIVPMLKKKHVTNMVDHVYCKKQMKKEKKDIEKLLRLPMFKSVSTMTCKMCGKKAHELDCEFVVETGNTKDAESYQAHTFDLCKKCYTKYKRRKTALIKDCSRGLGYELDIQQKEIVKCNDRCKADYVIKEVKA